MFTLRINELFQNKRFPQTFKEISFEKEISLLEQGTGVEPAAEAWEASVLPIY